MSYAFNFAHLDFRNAFDTEVRLDKLQILKTCFYAGIYVLRDRLIAAVFKKYVHHRETCFFL